MFRDYYKVLGIESSVSKKTIKDAYREMASRWHPDKNRNEDTTEKMKLINEAYLILNDDEARARYDRQHDRYRAGFRTKYGRAEGKTRDSAEEFQSNDEILNRWMANARRQAAVLAKQSFEDLVGITGAAMSGCYQEIKYLVLILVIFIIVILIF